MVKAVILDFDGVILESVAVKSQAFRQVFADYPEHVDEIVDYHMDQGGVSRFRKFEYIYENILKQDLSEQKSQELGELFTKYSYENVIAADFVPGAKEFLEQYYQDLPLYIATGTPQEEIDDVIREREFVKYFKAVYGSPTTKDVISKHILGDLGIDASEAIFVGDSITDYEGARGANVPFVGRLHPDYDNPFEGLPLLGLVRSLTELEQYLSSERISK